MVEKVAATTDTVPTATGTQEKPFVSEKVWTCPSCLAVNPASATKCGGCGDAHDPKKTPIRDTVAATCPNCLGARPFVPAHGDDPEQYYGDCPHCHQDSIDANLGKKKLESGDKSEWGKGAPH